MLKGVSSRKKKSLRDAEGLEPLLAGGVPDLEGDDSLVAVRVPDVDLTKRFAMKIDETNDYGSDVGDSFQIPHHQL